MTDNLTTPAKKLLSPTVWYLLFALAAGAVVWGWFWQLFPRLTAGIYATGPVFAMIHLALLGSLLTGALGVMFQLVPIAFQAPPIPKKTALWHLPLHVISVLVMVGGFLSANFLQVAVGGGLLLATTLLYLVQVYISYRKANNKSIVHQRLWIPVVGLLAVMGIGIWQALGFPGTGLSLLLSHIIIGVLWFWGGLALVVSYKFIPMFVLSHGYYANLKLSSSLYNAGIALLIVGFYWPFPNEPLPSLVGDVFIVGALFQASMDIKRILKARKRKRVVFPLKLTITATFTLFAAIALLLLALLLGQMAVAASAAYLFYFAGMQPLLAGYAQKIVPFLYYEYRYSRAADRKTAPLIDEMAPRVPVQAATFLYYACTGIGFVLIVAKAALFPLFIATMSRTLEATGFFALLLLILSLLYVLRIGGKRP